MSFQRFPYRQYPPSSSSSSSSRTQKDRVSDKKRYNAWCRPRNPSFVKIQSIPIPSASAPPKKYNIPTYYLPAQQKPTYLDGPLYYLRRNTSKGKEAYEWVSKGCLIGLREI